MELEQKEAGLWPQGKNYDIRGIKEEEGKIYGSDNR